MEDLEKRKEQNLRAPRPDTRAVTPSTRDLALALQRTSIERVPLLRASRPDLVAVAVALDEAEALAIAVSLDEVSVELPRFAEAARAVSVPVLRTDLMLEEFQVYESRAAGADAVVLRASLLPQDLLARLAQAARSTHMAAVIACASTQEIDRAAQLQPKALLLPQHLLDAPRPPRVLIIAETFAPGLRADAALDASFGDAADPAATFRDALEE
jgi:hypothetical protein